MAEPSPRRIALVTGASYGIGAASAVALARDGCDVAVADLDAKMLADTVAAVESAGVRALAVTLDVTVQSSVDAAFQRMANALGEVDVLVNNAGVPLSKPALETTREEWERVLSVNLTGAFFVSQRMAQRLIAMKRPGCIVNLASTFSFIATPSFAAYSVAKAGVAHMTKMLAIEWAQHGIRVNAIAPGSTETRTRMPVLNDPARRDFFINRIPLRRFGRPDEMGAAVRYLASADASYITGQTLLLDGGLTSY
ncbi:MAG: glucose 1-dehydrogenase [Variibacter sp.]|nr:glucose 1-dehydrogenase [Variibacter sp.]